MTGSLSDLVPSARSMMSRRPGSVAHRRGAVFIGRQAIEETTRRLLGELEHPRLTWRSRFLLLEYVSGLDGRTPAVLWRAWSELCHYHPYELVPDATTIDSMLIETARWVTSVDGG